VPEENDVVFANGLIDGEATEKSRLGIDPKGICFVAHLTGLLRLRGRRKRRRIGQREIVPFCLPRGDDWRKAAERE